MAVSRADRRRERTAAVIAVFSAEHAGPALDLLEIVELAWHDCYREITPDESIIEDILLLSDGQLDRPITAARLALTDWRDLKVAAINRRDGH